MCMLIRAKKSWLDTCPSFSVSGLTTDMLAAFCSSRITPCSTENFVLIDSRQKLKIDVDIF